MYIFVCASYPTYHEGVYLVMLIEKYVNMVGVISGFRRGVNEICVLLRCYAE
jgi:hypothetical protein